MSINLTPELESRLAKAAEAAGTTSDLLAQEYLSERLPADVGTRGDEHQSLADFLGDFIGMLDSSENVPGGANLSQDTGRRFTEILLEKRRQGHL